MSEQFYYETCLECCYVDEQKNIVEPPRNECLYGINIIMEDFFGKTAHIQKVEFQNDFSQVNIEYGVNAPPYIADFFQGFCKLPSKTVMIIGVKQYIKNRIEYLDMVDMGNIPIGNIPNDLTYLGHYLGR